MIDVIMTCVILIAIAGAFLTASSQRWQRLWGFIAFFVADIAWIVYAFTISDPWIAAQFTAFLVAAILGIYSNRK